MDPKVNTLERAFELARSGEFDTVEAIRRRLMKEGYVFRVLTGPYLSRQLRELMREARPLVHAR